MNHDTPLPDAGKLQPYTGGRTLMLGGAVLGLIGLGLTALLGMANPGQALLAYLVAYVYWLGIAVGALALVMANHIAGARWNVTVRRIGETLAGAIPLFVVLFIPLALGAKHVWWWVSPNQLSKAAEEAMQGKQGWFALGNWLLRTAFYFLVWTVLSTLLRRWSLQQDESGDPELTVKQRKLSAPGLLLLAFTITFAAFDWIMSLQPGWYSTIFGLYVFIGGFVASLSLVCLIVTGIRSGGGPLAELITVDHQHNLGKLLLAFTAFWAYMGFSQYMLIWAGNLPEELTWIVVRSRGPWGPIGTLLIIGHFVLPFFLLLSRPLKRNPASLAAVSAWMLVIHYVDVYWVVMPAANADRLGLSLTHLTAFAGVGGLSVAAGVFLLRGARAVPVKDPFLADSLRYVQP